MRKMMAYYLVRAKANETLLPELRERLGRDEIRAMRPFGTALHDGLCGARLLDDGRVVWEEEDYCRPPRAMERAAVLDTYFTDLTVEPVARGDGWVQFAVSQARMSCGMERRDLPCACASPWLPSHRPV